MCLWLWRWEGGHIGTLATHQRVGETGKGRNTGLVGVGAYESLTTHH